MQKAVLVLCLSLSACASGPPRDTGRVRDAVVRNNANAVRWYAVGDAESLAGMCAEDVWQMPPNHPALVGREAVREYWRQAFQWGKWDFTLDTQDVDVSGPLAVERGRYVLRFTAGPSAPPGMASFEDRGNYLAHWRYEADGQWRAVADAPVSELPLPPSPGPGKPTP
jgi:ketosteroid isomerase-like protein